MYINIPLLAILGISSITPKQSYVLKNVTRRYNVGSWLDAPCGMVVWTAPVISELRKEHAQLTYTGIDVVPSVIESNTKRLSDYADFMKFDAIDLSQPAKLPKADALISRDALQHLSYRGIAGALKNYCASNAGLLLLGSYCRGGFSSFDPCICF